MFKWSIVIPIYNEEKNIDFLYKRLKALSKFANNNLELIFVNDGSLDDSLFKLIRLHKKDSNVKIINFSRNFGHQMAVSAGLKYSTGDVVAIIDGDLQDPPEILINFIEKIKKGYDVVYGIRKKRKESFFMRLTYATYYRFLKLVADIDIPLDSGDFCMMRQKVVKAINLLPERNRFVRGLRAWVGFKQIGLEYERDARYKGQSKYTFKKIMKLAFDGIFSFSYVPFKIMFYLGFFSLIFSFLGAFFVFYMKFFTSHYNRVPGFATTVTLIIFIGGLQLFTMGIMGEYIKRIYDEVKKRPSYIIESTFGIKVKNQNDQLV